MTENVLKTSPGGLMANERLRAAMLSAGLTADIVASKVDVDPRTVERWVRREDRHPHRTTRHRVAKLLGSDERHLWPGLANDARTLPSVQTEVIHVYPTRSAVPFSLWTELIEGTQSRMDVLVFSGQFLVEQHNIIPIIKRKTEEGVDYRFVVGDEKAPTVIQRAAEEGTTGGLEGRIQMMRRYLRTVASLPNVSVWTHDTILYNSIYRFDEQMLVNPHVLGGLAGENPMLHLRAVEGGTMFDHYMKSFDRVLAQATPEPTGDN